VFGIWTTGLQDCVDGIGSYGDVRQASNWGTELIRAIVSQVSMYHPIYPPGTSFVSLDRTEHHRGISFDVMTQTSHSAYHDETTVKTRPRGMIKGGKAAGCGFGGIIMYI
jgi:hypothetical protein